MTGPDRARAGADRDKLGMIRDGAVLMEDGVVVLAAGFAIRVMRDERAKLGAHRGRRRACRAAGLRRQPFPPGFVGPAARGLRGAAAGKSYAEIVAGGGGILSTVYGVRGATQAQLHRGLASLGRALS